MSHCIEAVVISSRKLNMLLVTCISNLTWYLQVLTFTGAIINVMRIPEKWYHSIDPRMPGKFDYWLNSHNLMHILVAAAMTHYSIGAACDYLHFLQQTQCPA